MTCSEYISPVTLQIQGDDVGTKDVSTDDPKESGSILPIIVAVIGVIVLLVIVIIVGFFIRNKRFVLFIQKLFE